MDIDPALIDVATGMIWFLAFLFSTTVHEAMHALAAWRLGDPLFSALLRLVHPFDSYS